MVNFVLREYQSLIVGNSEFSGNASERFLKE